MAAKEEIINLHKFVDVFAWLYQDMLGLSTEIVEQRLLLDQYASLSNKN